VRSLYLWDPCGPWTASERIANTRQCRAEVDPRPEGTRTQAGTGSELNDCSRSLLDAGNAYAGDAVGFGRYGIAVLVSARGKWRAWAG
jgi:hypothetical protein